MNNAGLRTPIGGSKAIICPQCNFKIENIPLKILKPKLLIVEGRDEECFFCALIGHFARVSQGKSFLLKILVDP